LRESTVSGADNIKGNDAQARGWLVIDYVPAATHDQPRLFTVVDSGPTLGQGR